MEALFPLEGQLEISSKTRPLTQTSSLQIYLQLAEKTLFVQGFEPNDYKSRPPTLLRGALVVRVLKTAKLKTITLTLKGTARTEWPEGIPPKRTESEEETILLNHTWPFFANSTSSGADLFRPLVNESDDVTNLSLDVQSIRSLSQNSGSNALSVLKRVASPSPGRARSSSMKLFSAVTNDHHYDANNNEIFTFAPGDYIYKFEHPIPSSTPETIDATFGSVAYQLNVLVERYGAFKPNISTSLPINIVRAPSEESVEDSEPIAISKDWEDQLHYDIIIASKSIILNAYIPIAFKLVPLDKIKLHRIRIFLTENMEYYSRNKKIHRMEPLKKFMVLELKAPPPKDLPPDADSKQKKMGNLLSSDGSDLTAKEFEFQVYVPEKLSYRSSLHPTTSYANIKSHHWIKICLRLSRMIEGKPKHYEISIDSPIHILNKLCSHANTLLPAYGIPTSDSPNQNLQSNIYFPPEVINSPELSPKISSVENMRSLSSALGVPALNRNRNRSASSSSVNNQLENPQSTLSFNIYKPDHLDYELTSPQAVPISPISSPVQRPIHLIRRPSYDPPPFEHDTSPPPLSILRDNSSQSLGIDSQLGADDLDSAFSPIDALTSSSGFSNLEVSRSGRRDSRSIDRSFTPLNSPPPVTRTNGVKSENIPMDPPTYDDFLEMDGIVSPFLHHAKLDRSSIPEVSLTDDTGKTTKCSDENNDGGDLCESFAFKGSPDMPSSVLRSTSPSGQRKRGIARSPRLNARASFDLKPNDETIDSLINGDSSERGFSTNENNDENAGVVPFAPERGSIDSDSALSRMSSRSSLSSKDFSPNDINDSQVLFEPLLHHCNSTQVTLDQHQHPYSQQHGGSHGNISESHDSLSVMREPLSVDLTSLYSRNNPFVVPNVSNILSQNSASQRRRSAVNHDQSSNSSIIPVPNPPPQRPVSNRTSSIQSMTPILAILDKDEQTASSQSNHHKTLSRSSTHDSIPSPQKSNDSIPLRESHSSSLESSTGPSRIDAVIQEEYSQNRTRSSSTLESSGRETLSLNNTIDTIESNVSPSTTVDRSNLSISGGIFSKSQAGENGVTKDHNEEIENVAEKLNNVGLCEPDLAMVKKRSIGIQMEDDLQIDKEVQ